MAVKNRGVGRDCLDEIHAWALMAMFFEVVIGYLSLGVGSWSDIGYRLFGEFSLRVWYTGKSTWLECSRAHFRYLPGELAKVWFKSA